MAITKILPVRGQLKGCLDYAANPQKTEYFSTADMQRLIGYTQNKDKTEHQLYVSGFNCMPQNKCRKITGFMAFYYRYCALLRKAYKGKVGKRCYYLLRDDFLKYNRYRRQCDLLWKRQITTLDELLTYKENLQAEYSTLTAQRRALYRGKSKTTPADYSEQIQALTARIRELRREITTCADIEMDCEMVQDKVQRAAHRRENPPRERIHRRAY